MKAALAIDSTPCPWPKVPFSSERGIQRFLVTYAENIFGLTVISSTLPDGRPLFDIDVLAIDTGNRPFIFECKHKTVDAGAIRQLFAYKVELEAGWSLFERRVIEVRRPQQVIRERHEPVLVCIGYGYKPSVRTHVQSVVCLTYAYHVTLTDDVVHHRLPGSVSIQYADTEGPISRHPVVSKKDATDKRLEPFPAAAKEAFWSIHTTLKALAGVVPPTWRGKNVIDYRVGKTVFAKVFMRFPSIQWNVTLPASRTVWVVSGSEEDQVYRVLLEAYSSTCQKPKGAA